MMNDRKNFDPASTDSYIRHSSFVFVIRASSSFHRCRFSIQSIDVPSLAFSQSSPSSLAGCAAPWGPRLTLPNRNTIVREQLTVHSDFPLPEQDASVGRFGFAAAGDNRQLMLPVSDEPIHIYLFDNEDHFRSFMRLHHPDFPSRRAFFLETKTRMEVYAQAGERMAEDLRHEVTHGYLHSAVPNLPLWLDEGLAKYYEVPRGRHGLNQPLIELFKNRPPSKPWKMDWSRLEKIPPDEEMSLEDYAEAWAWVHFLLEDRPEYREILCRYLADLRRDGKTEPLSARLAAVVPQPEIAMVEHLRKIINGGKKFPPSESGFYRV